MTGTNEKYELFLILVLVPLLYGTNIVPYILVPGCSTSYYW